MLAAGNACPWADGLRGQNKYRKERARTKMRNLNAWLLGVVRKRRDRFLRKIGVFGDIGRRGQADPGGSPRDLC